ncbi:hypothetical protein FVER14953_20314 [Fusarium verticillioides]|nr:hypothetical protein FVER14953_20314 [Fusarium verticillioides]
MRTVLGDDSCHIRGFDLQIAILQMLEAIHGFELPQQSSKPEKYEKGYAADEVSDWNQNINNPFGLDVSTI